MARETARVHADADGADNRRTRRSQLSRDFSSAGYLKAQKKDMEKMKVPNCIKPDVCYHQGYLAGYTESSSSWSFFTQWYEVMFRCDGSVRPCGPKLGPCASAGRPRLPRAAHGT